MPLTVGGSAEYNVSNIAGAALAALELGVSSTTVAEVLARFGADPADNPGRLMRYDYRGAQVLIDYAHNPEGLQWPHDRSGTAATNGTTRGAAGSGRQP